MAFGEFDFARVSRSRNEVKADIINSVAKLANTLVSSQECPKKSRIRPSFCNADNNRIGFNHLYYAAKLYIQSTLDHKLERAHA